MVTRMSEFTLIYNFRLIYSVEIVLLPSTLPTEYFMIVKLHFCSFYHLMAKCEVLIYILVKLNIKAI